MTTPLVSPFTKKDKPQLALSEPFKRNGHAPSEPSFEPDLTQRHYLNLNAPGLLEFLARAERGRRKESLPDLHQAGRSLSRAAEPDIVETILENGWCTARQWGMVAKYHSRDGRLPDFNGPMTPRSPPDKWLAKIEGQQGSKATQYTGTSDPVSLMKQDLAKSGLTPEDMGSYPTTGMPQSLGYMDKKRSRDDKTDYTAEALKYWLASYVMPRPDPDTGEWMTDVPLIRNFFKPGAPGWLTDKKYLAPTRAAYGDRAVMPYLHPGRLDSDQPWIGHSHEGWKKARSAIKHARQNAIGVEGNQNWRSENKNVADYVLSLNSHIHRFIQGLIAAGEEHGETPEFHIWPDGDVNKPSVQQGYGDYCAAIRHHYPDLKLVIRDVGRVPNPDHVDAKFDDLVGRYGAEHAVSHAGLLEPGEFKRSLKSLAEEFGLDMSGGDFPRPLPSFPNVKKIIEKHPNFKDQFKLNSDRGLFEYRGELYQGDTHLGNVREFIESDLGLRSRDGNLAKQHVVDAVKQAFMVNTYSPFKDYLLGLEWDGQTRFQDLARALGTAQEGPDGEWAVRVLRSLLIASVSRIMEPGCLMRWMFIFHGKQKIGKSGFFNALYGIENVKLFLNKGHKFEHLMRMAHEGLFLNMDELEDMAEWEVASLKGFVSAQWDSYKAKLYFDEVHLPRSSMLGGTCNETNFLPTDPSGLDRYVVLTSENEYAQQFDWEWLARGRDQLWAEAVAAWRAGERAPYVDGAAERAQQHKAPNLLDQMILHELRRRRDTLLKKRVAVYKGKEVVKVSCAELGQWCDENVFGRAAMKYKRIMEDNGWSYSGDTAIGGDKKVMYVSVEKFIEQYPPIEEGRGIQSGI